MENRAVDVGRDRSSTYFSAPQSLVHDGGCGKVRIRSQFAIALASGILSVGAEAQSHRALRGFPPIQVIIEVQGDRGDLEVETLRTAIELRLRQNRIRVIPRSDTTTYPRSFLNVEVQSVMTKDNTQRIIRYDVYLDEIARLYRTTDYPVYGRIWDGLGGVALLGVAHSPKENVTQTVMEQVDRFLNSYLTINPLK